MGVLKETKLSARMDAKETVLVEFPSVCTIISSRTCAIFVRSAVATCAGSEQGLPGKYDQLSVCQ
jgi:hypothetical protein